MGDPNDHPGYVLIDLRNTAGVIALEAQGYRLAKDASPNVLECGWAVFSKGYND